MEYNVKNNFKIAILPGDGIGPLVIKQVIKLFKVMNDILDVKFNLINIPCGGKYYLEHKKEWPDDAFKLCCNADAILLGAVGYQHNGQVVMTIPNKPYITPKLAGYAPVIGNRQKLNLYANVRPIKLYPEIKQKISGKYRNIWSPEHVDYVIVRENTEDAYTGEFVSKKNKVITPIQITFEATTKVIRYACNLARKRNKKKKITCVDKSNIIEAHRYFRQIFTEICKSEFSDLQFNYAYADAFCQSQIMEPELYDVVVAPNFVGDIISDNAAITQGGLGMAPSANIGDFHAMFEPIHGSALNLVGSGNANPLAAILSMKIMLDWLGERHNNLLLTISDYIEKAVMQVISESVLTPDVIEAKYSVNCDAVGNTVAREFRSLLSVLNKNKGDIYGAN